jgi:rare lipoprotein A
MANGKRFDMTKLTVAHKKLPFGTKLKITNLINQKSVIVEVTDRGPFVKSREIDLSKRAFTDIANDKNSGLMTVKIEISE